MRFDSQPKRNPTTREAYGVALAALVMLVLCAAIGGSLGIAYERESRLETGSARACDSLPLLMPEVHPELTLEERSRFEASWLAVSIAARKQNVRDELRVVVEVVRKSAYLSGYDDARGGKAVDPR